MKTNGMNERHEKRTQWKKAAKDVVKTHFVLLVILCLIGVFYGTEFGHVKLGAQEMYHFVTGETSEIGENVLKADAERARDKVFDDLVEDNIEAGREHQAAQLAAYREEKPTNDVLGRRRGIFAAIANQISSGQLYIVLFNGLHSIVHSSRVASALVVAGDLLLIIAVWIFLRNVYQVVLRRIFLEARTYPLVPVSHVLHLHMVKRWARASITALKRSIYLTLWGLTVVGYPIKRYSYMLVPYIAAENPDIKSGEAITLSRKMMDGHKWEGFLLELSFIGWELLGFLTFGAGMVLWVIPYKTATMAEFYAERRAEAIKAGIPGAERLDDIYLYEPAEEALLRQTYHDIEEEKKFIDENRVTLPPKRAFFAKNFGLWIGSAEEKRRYDEVDNRRQQIVEERAVIKQKIYPQRLTPLWDEKNNHSRRVLRYIRTYTVWSLILTFFTFSFVGWLWEVSIHLVMDGVFVNRGFFHGPWLPIYGGGVVLILVLLARFRNKPGVEAAAIVVLCGFVEYFTSYFLELSCGLRWWDYTGYYLNLNGRICGEGLMTFALGGMAAVYFAVPILDNLWSRLKPRVMAIICLVLMLAFGADIIYTKAVPNTGDGITDYTAYQEVEG